MMEIIRDMETMESKQKLEIERHWKRTSKQ